MKRLVVAFAASALALATAPLAAQSLDAPRYYVALGANFADHQYDLPGANVFDGDYFLMSYKVFGGVELDPRWGVEIGYVDFTEADFDYMQGDAIGRGSTRGYGAYVAGRGRWPFHPQLALFGKLGLAYSHRKLESNLPLTAASDNNDTGLYAGVGLQWNINEEWALVGEYERYGRTKKIGSRADVFTVSARFSF